MKHEHGDAFRRVDEADLAAIWPVAAGIPTTPVAELQSPERAAPDIPAAVGRLLAGSYFALIGACFLTLTGSPEALFMVVVSGLYVLVYCAVPWLFFRVEADPTQRPSLTQFMARGLDTATGPLSGRAALVQMLVVPATLTLCLLTIGTLAGLFLPR